MWYGGASLRSATWAGEHAMNFLTSSVRQGGGTERARGRAYDFAALQLAQIRAFRAAHPDGEQARVSQGLVVLPTDTRDPGAAREVRGVRRLPARAHPDAAGSGAGCCSRPTWSARPRSSRALLGADPAFREVDEVAFALPFTFEPEDYVQILTDMATRLGPLLGWEPNAWLRRAADAPRAGPAP